MTKKNQKNKSNNILLSGVSESEFLTVLDNISARLSHKFRFGYHNIEDMKQQAAIFAMEGLAKYDKSRPLENFLWTHVRNRLFNYKRNNYQRPDKPCATCPFFDKSYKLSNNQCSKYINKKDCDLYASWSNRNEAKKNIMQPVGMDYDPSNSTEFTSVLSNSELVKFLDEHIHSDYRESYLRLKHGEKLNKQKLTKLQNHIKLLIQDFHSNNKQSDYEY
jgi:hypothetical protein